MKIQDAFKWYGLLFITTFIIDRITKYYALNFTQPHVVHKFLSCQLMMNRGISWSFFHSDDNRIFLALTIFLLAITAALAFYTYIRWMNHYAIFGETLVLSGAISNIIDRFSYQGVIDFIAIRCESWSFPVFNCADIFIVVGVILMLITNYQDS